MAEAPKFNLRNPAVKRIMQEIKEIKQDTSGEFLAEALETDIFEWHFVIRGPQDTEFNGGIYHGRILLPAEYPFKPPSFMMLTPNGRFETSVKICLSISSHHPEHWQPSWSVRTALTALIAFMPSPGAGALGALDFTKEERRVLAARSRLEAPRFGSSERQRVIDEMHARMLSIATAKEAERQARDESPGQPTEGAAPSGSRPESDTGAPATEPPQTSEPAAAAGQDPSPAGAEDAAASGTSTAKACTEHAEARTASLTPGALGSGQAADSSVAGAPATASSSSAVPAAPAPGVALEKPTTQQATVSVSGASAVTAAAAPATHQRPSATAAAAAAVAPPPPVVPARWGPGGAGVAPAAAGTTGATTSTDHMLTALMWALYVGIGAILLRKVMGVMGVDLAELLQG